MRRFPRAKAERLGLDVDLREGTADLQALISAARWPRRKSRRAAARWRRWPGSSG
jgi:hypothetical protein